MLEQLVKEIRSGGSLENQSLAARLGTTPVVEAMMDPAAPWLDPELCRLWKRLPGLWPARRLPGSK